MANKAHTLQKVLGFLSSERPRVWAASSSARKVENSDCSGGMVSNSRVRALAHCACKGEVEFKTAKSVMAPDLTCRFLNAAVHFSR